MKKVIIIIVLTILSFGLFGCKKGPIREYHSNEDYNLLITEVTTFLEVNKPTSLNNDPSLHLEGLNYVPQANFDSIKNSLDEFSGLIISTESDKDLVEDKYLSLIELFDNVKQTSFIGTRKIGKLGDQINIVSVESNTSRIDGDIDSFLAISKPDGKNGIKLTESILNNHLLVIDLYNVYPIKNLIIRGLRSGNSDLSINRVEYGFDKTKFNRLEEFIINENMEIAFNGIQTRYIRFQFSGTEDIDIYDLKVFLDKGIMVFRAPEWDEIYRQQKKGWTGADGVYSFNLSDGDRSIGAKSDMIAFIYSDTFVGEIGTNNVRYRTVMVNNTISYYDPSKPHLEAMEFEWGINEEGKPDSIFLPHAFTGNRASQLVDGVGLKPNNTIDGKLINQPAGTQWLSNWQENIEIKFNLFKTHNLGTIAIWNYNDEVNSQFGAKKIRILFSSDDVVYEQFQEIELEMSSGLNLIPYNKLIENINQEVRYIKIEVLESHSAEYVGLGKVLLLDTDNNPIWSEVTSNSELLDVSGLEASARIWLEDGIVIDDKLFIFVMLIKDDGNNFFNINTFGVLEVPIIDGKTLDHKNTIYRRTPLLANTSDGGRMYFGGAILDNTEEDGYIYISGFKDDINLTRFMVMARTTRENIINFNEWTYYDGSNFVKNIDKAKGLLKYTSPELSLTKITSGMYKDKFMVVTMIGTISGRIGYAVADNPWGPYELDGLQEIWRTEEEELLKKSTFTYNAKMQPLFSEPGRWLVTFNVNSNSAMGLQDGRVYYPRSLWFIEVEE